MSYVIRKVDGLNYAGRGTWEEKSIATVSFTGEKFLADAKTVHNIICINIAEDSDAYTWIKPSINGRNGRSDMVTLRGHFSGDVSDQVLGDEANVNFDNLFYRSECQMIFETFVTKFTNAVNDKDRVGPARSKRGNLGTVPAPVARGCHGPLKTLLLAPLGDCATQRR